ncbi:MAG TPA: acyl-CoA dehydrogenase family protein [Thermoanaerobaculia bacterium]|nr:acyl-CoA dehydrogenase family protein [Thermoanaerobaculia bacterium]
MSTQLRFSPVRVSGETDAFRLEVRDFLERERQAGTWGADSHSWGGFNPELSRKLGARGWIGMTWPRQYGGGERSYLERYVYTEELLAAGAPAGAHWVADRQSGPLFLRFGTEEQKERFLPPITRGEAYYSIGMSEPDAGSDLASIRSRADRDGDGWRLTGTKIWTSGAHRNHWMIALVRTEPLGADRHAGMSQFVVDLASEGLTVRPIKNLAGDEGFNEVVMDRVFVPNDRLLGEAGAGWRQVTSELAYERAGPERFLTNLHLLRELLAVAGEDPPRDVRARIGRVASHLWTLRQMSLSVAAMLSDGILPNTEAALAKDLGTHFQQELPQVAREVIDVLPSSEAKRAYRRLLDRGVLAAPAYTIQGGTTEILRGIIARGLGLR